MEELKLCPFCGGEAQLITKEDLGGFSAYVECLSCKSRTISIDMDKEKAVAAWNTRYTLHMKPIIHEKE